MLELNEVAWVVTDVLTVARMAVGFGVSLYGVYLAKADKTINARLEGAALIAAGALMMLRLGA